jgi:hypothetical protein
MFSGTLVFEVSDRPQSPRKNERQHMDDEEDRNHVYRVTDCMLLVCMLSILSHLHKEIEQSASLFHRAKDPSILANKLNNLKDSKDTKGCRLNKIFSIMYL